jgi:hypothetical protein
MKMSGPTRTKSKITGMNYTTKAEAEKKNGHRVRRNVKLLDL